MDPMAAASCSGDTIVAPCPMATEIVSPAYHFCLCVLIFQADDGTNPAASLGKIDPGLMSQSDHFRVVIDRVDSHFIA